jgi:PAB-dependent poly(A)-specific ribonuclease subunit 2
MSVPLYHQQAPFGAQMAFPQPVASLSFDPISDTLWAGSTTGLVHAYHGASRMRGVSYFVTRGEPIKRIIASESVVHACTSTSVGSWGKGGVNKWYHQLSASVYLNLDVSLSCSNHAAHSRPVRGATAFEHHPTKPHTLVIAQSAPEFLLLNSTTGAVLRTMMAPSVVTALKASHSALLSGAADGVLRVHDVRTPGSRADSDPSEMSVLAHVGGILAIDIGGTTALTIGWSLRFSISLMRWRILILTFI